MKRYSLEKQKKFPEQTQSQRPKFLKLFLMEI